MPERILWLVDEYVMKSELPERLVRIIEQATHPPGSHHVPTSGASVAVQQRKESASWFRATWFRAT